MIIVVPSCLKDCLLQPLNILYTDKYTLDKSAGDLKAPLFWPMRAVIILFKSNMDAISNVMFYCTIPFQRYQTWYVYNYLNLISSHASSWEGVVLVMVQRATSSSKCVQFPPCWYATVHRTMYTCTFYSITTGLDSQLTNDRYRPITGLEKCQDSR